MKTVLACLLTATLLTTIARADIFIYRGVDQFNADAQTAAPFASKTINAYLIVDFDAGQTGQILYGRIEGGKRFQQSTATASNFTTAILPNGKIASIIVSGSNTNTSPSDFSNNITFYRGTNTTLLIRKTPSHTIALRPSVLKGASISASSSQTFVDLHSGLTLVGAATIKANNANQTIDQALGILAAQLMAKGFTSL